MRHSLERSEVFTMGVAMAIIAPKGRKHLSADALFRLVRSGFANIPDHCSDEVDISLTDALMSGFAMFSLKSPSLLAFDNQRVESNLETIYGTFHTRLATHACGSDSIPYPRSRYGHRSRVSFVNSSAVRHWRRWYFLTAIISWHSMARGIFPRRRFTVTRVCTRSIAMVRSPIITNCWGRRFSIQTAVKSFL